MRRVRPPHPRLLTALLALALAASACGRTHHRSASTPTTQASTSPSASPSATSRQISPIVFSNCTGQFQFAIGTDRARKTDFGCARIPVPLDYAHPDGPTIQLFIVRMHLQSQQATARIGSILVNPGGPGESGVNFTASLLSSVDPSLLARFDLIGFDPRGVGLSSPVQCLSTQQKDALVTQDADVRTAAGRAAAKTLALRISQQCEAKYGPSLADYNTEYTARDLDRLRQGLGEQRLNFLGFSYGAQLGATYAHLFPSTLRTAVLDGPVNPTASPLAVDEQQTAGFEAAFNGFAANCSVQPACAGLGPARSTAQQLLVRARTSAIPSSRKGETRKAGPGLVLNAIASALYDPHSWPALAQALLQAKLGDAAGLFALSDAHDERDAQSGQYSSNLLDANTVVNCNDGRVRLSDAAVASTATAWARRYPLFGLQAAASLYACTGWPPLAHPLPSPSAPTAAPVLVVGTEHDPATPYAGAVAMAKALGSGVLLTWNGQGHTAYPKTQCIRNAVDNYLIAATTSAQTCPGS